MLTKFKTNFVRLILNIVSQSGTLAGNITLKKLHPEFSSDIFLLFETVEAKMVISYGNQNDQEMTLQEFVRSKKNEKIVIKYFKLKAYSTKEFTFRSYKVSLSNKIIFYCF